MRALSVELVGTGVSVGSFAPGGIDTDMAALSDLKWGKLGLMDVDRCAAHAIHALVHRRSFAIPGMGNRLTYLASRALPRSLVSRPAVLPYRRPHSRNMFAARLNTSFSAYRKHMLEIGRAL